MGAAHQQQLSIGPGIDGQDDGNRFLGELPLIGAIGLVKEEQAFVSSEADGLRRFEGAEDGLGPGADERVFGLRVEGESQVGGNPQSLLRVHVEETHLVAGNGGRGAVVVYIAFDMSVPVAVEPEAGANPDIAVVVRDYRAHRRLGKSFLNANLFLVIMGLDACRKQK